MSKFPALPLFVDAYLADASHLTDADHGRYLLLLMLLWRSPKCRAPNDDQWLAHKLGRTVGDVQECFRPLIKEFCKSDGNWITQKRLAKEWNYVEKSIKQRTDAAKSRWGNEKKDKAAGAPHVRKDAAAYAPTPTPTPTPTPPISPTPPAAEKREVTPIGVVPVRPQTFRPVANLPWWDEYRTYTGETLPPSDDWPVSEEDVLLKLARAKNTTRPVDYWRRDWLTVCANLRAQGMTFLGVQVCSVPGWGISEAAIIAAELAMKERTAAENALH